MTLVAPPRAAERSPSLDTVLTPIHDRWLKEIRRMVQPATFAGAAFWDRWSAVRYLADQFRVRFRLEAALLASLDDLLPAAEAARLTAEADRLDRVLAELDVVGRRRSSGEIVAELAQLFIREIALWCAGLERALAKLPRDRLPAVSARLLGQLLEPAVAFAG